MFDHFIFLFDQVAADLDDAFDRMARGADYFPKIDASLADIPVAEGGLKSHVYEQNDRKATQFDVAK